MEKRSSFSIFLSVQNALFLRELNMRFSSGRMGIFWTFFEPFFQIMVFIIIKVAPFGRANSDFDFAVFLALNFTAFNMFKNIVIKSTGAFKANKALFLYKQVKPIDTILARTMIEVFITTIIIAIFISIGLYFDFEMEIKDFSMVAMGFIFLIIFSLSLSIFLAVLSTFIESVSRLIGFVMTALMFTSAVFFSIEMLPLKLQTLIMYNPLAHFMTMIDGAYFYALDDHLVSYGYMFLWTFSLLYLGLWSYIKLEKRIISA